MFYMRIVDTLSNANEWQKNVFIDPRYDSLKCSINLDRFYIILRGQVSVLHRDAYEDMDLGEEGQKRRVDISTLGNLLVQLGDLLYQYHI